MLQNAALMAVVVTVVLAIAAVALRGAVHRSPAPRRQVPMGDDERARRRGATSQVAAVDMVDRARRRGRDD